MYSRSGMVQNEDVMSDRLAIYILCIVRSQIDKTFTTMSELKVSLYGPSFLLVSTTIIHYSAYWWQEERATSVSDFLHKHIRHWQLDMSQARTSSTSSKGRGNSKSSPSTITTTLYRSRLRECPSCRGANYLKTRQSRISRQPRLTRIHAIWQREIRSRRSLNSMVRVGFGVWFISRYVV